VGVAISDVGWKTSLRGSGLVGIRTGSTAVDGWLRLEKGSVVLKTWPHHGCIYLKKLILF
jgi:hypothetical protein